MGGVMFPELFIEQIVKAALDPNRQYYKLLADYNSGRRKSLLYKELARATKKAGETETSSKIILDYLRSIDTSKLFL